MSENIVWIARSKAKGGQRSGKPYRGSSAPTVAGALKSALDAGVNCREFAVEAHETTDTPGIVRRVYNLRDGGGTCAQDVTVPMSEAKRLAATVELSRPRLERRGRDSPSIGGANERARSWRQ